MPSFRTVGALVLSTCVATAVGQFNSTSPAWMRFQDLGSGPSYNASYSFFYDLIYSAGPNKPPDVTAAQLSRANPVRVNHFGGKVLTGNLKAYGG